MKVPISDIRYYIFPSSGGIIFHPAEQLLNLVEQLLDLGLHLCAHSCSALAVVEENTLAERHAG